MAQRDRIPAYRLHRPSGQAVVRIDGKDFYLGRYGTVESRAEYDRVIAEWLAAGRMVPATRCDLTIAELCLRYWRFAKSYYTVDGKPTGSLDRVKVAIRTLKDTYAHTLAKDFGPLALQAIQQKLAASGRCRRYCNHIVDQIKRIFKWGVAQQLVPETVYRAIQTVPGLRKGRSPAPERPPVRPVPDEVIEATLPYLPPVVADMVRLHRLIGARPAEVCAMRPCDIDTSGPVWVYIPQHHKTEYRDHQRVIFIGPKAQEILRPYLLRPKDSFCFVPAESEKKRLIIRHRLRKTPLSCGNRPGSNRKRRPKKKPGEAYTTHAYYYAIRRAVAKANRERLRQHVANGGDAKDAPQIPYWTPNQLRHTAATEIRKLFGLEAVQAVLGHRNMLISEVYAEKNLSLAREVARQIG